MKLPFLCYLKCFSPIMTGLIPAKIRYIIKKVIEKYLYLKFLITHNQQVNPIIEIIFTHKSQEN